MRISNRLEDFLMNPLHRLTNAGLLIEEPDPEDLSIAGERWLFQNMYYIAKPAVTPNTSMFFGADRIPVEAPSSRLYRLKTSDQWVFCVHHYIPGPGPSDIFCEFALLDEVASIILNYYFGKATVIGQWLVPLHRYPELQYRKQLLQQTIAQAVHQTPLQMEEYLEHHRQHIRAKDWQGRIWDRALAFHFLSIPHISNSSAVLRLRRDLQEAFIVSEFK